MSMHFVIAGKPDCPLFMHAIYLARYLHKKLPAFDLDVVQKKSGLWEPWLQKANFKNNWCHASSPLIWKEIAMRGGRAHYIGGLSEFWEYVYDYYDLESIICQEDLKKMIRDNLQYLRVSEQEEKKRKYLVAQNEPQIRKIGIMGACHSAVGQLLAEILEIEGIKRCIGDLTVSLYDDDADVSDALQDIVQDLFPQTGKHNMFSLEEKPGDLIKDCNLLIVLGDYTRQEDEQVSDWLLRNMSTMFSFADLINSYARRDLRLVLAVQGPACFDANMLADTCTSIRIQNIVAVTADAGLGPLKCAAEQAGVSLADLGACPVWGSTQVAEYVDVEGAILRCDLYRHYQRSMRYKEGATLPRGSVESELRLLAYLLDDPQKIGQKALQTRKIVQDRLSRPCDLAKIRATVSLLKIWYSSEEREDRIIALGIYGNGSYGIPAGLVFSQPAILSPTRQWTPFKNFPVSEQTRKKIENELVPEYLQLLDNMNVGRAR